MQLRSVLQNSSSAYKMSYSCKVQKQAKSFFSIPILYLLSMCIFYESKILHLCAAKAILHQSSYKNNKWYKAKGMFGHPHMLQLYSQVFKCSMGHVLVFFFEVKEAVCTADLLLPREPSCRFSSASQRTYVMPFRSAGMRRQTKAFSVAPSPHRHGCFCSPSRVQPPLLNKDSQPILSGLSDNINNALQPTPVVYT